MVDVGNAQEHRPSHLVYFECFLRRSGFDMDPGSFATDEEKDLQKIEISVLKRPSIHEIHVRGSIELYEATVRPS